MTPRLTKRELKKLKRKPVPTCRVCGCTDNNCSGCIRKTGQPCSWVRPGLCSACVP